MSEVISEGTTAVLAVLAAAMRSAEVCGERGRGRINESATKALEPWEATLAVMDVDGQPGRAGARYVAVQLPVGPGSDELEGQIGASPNFKLVDRLVSGNRVTLMVRKSD